MIRRAIRSLISALARGRRGHGDLNVLWICADDYAPYVSGTYGNPLARTPNLDRLAAQGIRFDRAYCACPLSTPSRMAFLTGRYPRSVGVTLSPTPLPESEVTIGGLLRRAGYEAIALGKTHYYAPLRREFDRCVDLPEHEAWLDARPPEPLPPGVDVLGRWRPFHDRARVWLNADGLPYAPDAEMPDTFLTEMAERFLARKRRTQPFFLWLGFYVTHSPFRFPIEFRGRFDPASFEPPPVGPEDEGRIPAVFRGLTDDDKRGIAAAYYTSVAYMDRNVGRILDALDRSGHADKTLVLFNSDHGYLLGHHGRFEKHCMFEEAVRTALIARLPGIIEPGRASEALVELIDVVPTILEVCVPEDPPALQGRSFAPILFAETRRHRDHVVAEYADNAEAMVRDARWKLIYSAGNRRRRDGYAPDVATTGRSVRLYDMVQDPHEMTDVAGRSENAAVIEALLGTLLRHLRDTGRHPDRDADTSGDIHDLLDGLLLPAELAR